VTLEWAPDGRHFLTATIAPRLRVDNGLHLYRRARTRSGRAHVCTPRSLWQPRPPDSISPAHPPAAARPMSALRSCRRKPAHRRRLSARSMPLGRAAALPASPPPAPGTHVQHAPRRERDPAGRPGAPGTTARTCTASGARCCWRPPGARRRPARSQSGRRRRARPPTAPTGGRPRRPWSRSARRATCRPAGAATLARPPAPPPLRPCFRSHLAAPASTSGPALLMRAAARPSRCCSAWRQSPCLTVRMWCSGLDGVVPMQRRVCRAPRALPSSRSADAASHRAQARPAAAHSAWRMTRRTAHAGAWAGRRCGRSYPAPRRPTRRPRPRTRAGAAPRAARPTARTPTRSRRQSPPPRPAAAATTRRRRRRTTAMRATGTRRRPRRTPLLVRLLALCC